MIVIYLIPDIAILRARQYALYATAPLLTEQQKGLSLVAGKPQLIIPLAAVMLF